MTGNLLKKLQKNLLEILIISKLVQSKLMES